MTLNRWFQRNASRPLALASVFIGLLWAILLVALLSEISNRQYEGTRQLANLLSLSFSQRNRVLTESLLESSVVNLQANSAIICQGDKAIVASNSDNVGCTRAESWLFPKITQKIPGSTEYRLITTFSRFGDRIEIWRFFLIGLIFTCGCFVLLYRIKQRFLADIFLPLQSGLYNDTVIPIDEFEQVRQKRKVIEEAKEKDAVLQAVLENKTKVVHNIKSPLRTLRFIQESITSLIPSRDAKLLGNAIDSINNILGEQQNEFLKLASKETDFLPGLQATELVLLNDFVDETVALKSAEFKSLKNLRIRTIQSDESSMVFVSVVKHELRAIISNLINNSADSIGSNNGLIEIESKLENGQAKVLVRDTGNGIDEIRRHLIFEKGVTFKEGGTGFGLYHARQYLSQWGAKIEHANVAAMRGAVFEITLPIANPPEWFARKIEVKSKKNILIFDDDILIHNTLAEKLRTVVSDDITKMHFAFNEAEFESCLEEISSEISESLILCDYDLGISGKTGFEIVKAYGVDSRTVMVTNSFENAMLRKNCLSAGIAILPKACIGGVIFE